MKTLRIVGIMSGTSVDGVDYALCRIGGGNLECERFWSVKYPAALRRRIHRVASNKATSFELSQLHHDLGRFYAENVSKGLRGSKKIDGVGLHGQTVFHNPGGSTAATHQVGEAVYLSEKLRCPVVSGFREGDLAVGGQGAPLATIFHREAFARLGLHVCVNNLGGISNVTSLDWSKGKKPRILAFDTGPANVLVDMAMRHYSKGQLSFDEDGRWSAHGISSEKILIEWLKHPYFAKKPPKSTGRELFGEKFFKSALKLIEKTRTPGKARLSHYDAVATFAEFTARSLVVNYVRHLPSLPDVVVLAGGGAFNSDLVKRIRKNLHLIDPSVHVTTCDALGWSSQAIEAMAFALLAYYRMMDLPGNIPETTGARRAVRLGQVTEL